MKAYLEYDSDEDYNGARGRAIADALLDKYHGNFEKMRKQITLARLEKSLLEIQRQNKSLVLK